MVEVPPGDSVQDVHALIRATPGAASEVASQEKRLIGIQSVLAGEVAPPQAIAIGDKLRYTHRIRIPNP
jgi:hypothetical protein